MNKDLAGMELHEAAASVENTDLLVAKAVANRMKEFLGDKLRKVILFGSRARGDSIEDSDFDFVIIADFEEPSWPKRASAISRYVNAERDFRISTDYIPVTEWEFENKFLLRRSVKEEGVILYERGHQGLDKES